MDILQSLNFRVDRFILLTLITYAIFFIFSRHRNKSDKFILFILILFIFIYSGVGASLNIVPANYIFYYSIYLLLFIFAFTTIAFKKFIPSRLQYNFEEYMRIKAFSLKTCKKIIWISIILYLISSLYPEFNFLKLFKFKKPELNFTTEIFSKDIIQSILYYILLIIQPFYILSLFIYKKSPIKFFVALFLPLYFSYTIGGYVSRSALLPYFLVFIAVVYHFNENYRKYIFWLSLFSLLPLITLLYIYSVWRLGDAPVNISVQQAILMLFSQEFSFPVLFKALIESNSNFDSSKFFLWLITLPIPGFMKDPSFSVTINFDFTEQITGIFRDSKNFSVLLPGVVTESYFVFGKYFFFILALLTGWIMGFVYKIIDVSSRFIVLKYFFIFFMGVLLARAGSSSLLPLAINGFLIFYIYILSIRQHITKRAVVKKESCGLNY